MKIGIDARFMGPEGTGLGRYIEELVKELELIDQDNQYVIFLRKANYDFYQPRNKNFKKVIADARWYSLREQIVMPFKIYQEKIDLMHFGHFNIPIFYRGRFIVTIHDLIKSEYASKSATTRAAFVYWLKHRIYKYVIKKAILKSKKIITPSNYVKNKLAGKYPVDYQKIVVTPEAADEKFAKWSRQEISGDLVAKTLRKYEIEKPYLIYVGNSYPYKNLSRLLQAMKLIDRRVKLINPCARSVFYNRLKAEVKTLGLDKRILLPGFVPDEELSILYRHAEAYVFPSLSEGFGIPALEAMESGLPVICSNMSSLPEVCKDAAIYFDPFSIKDIAAKINNFLTTPDLRKIYKEKGFKRAKLFSWKSCAKKTLDIYKSAIK